jgi:hypothetical protein
MLRGSPLVRFFQGNGASHHTLKEHLRLRMVFFPIVSPMRPASETVMKQSKSAGLLNPDSSRRHLPSREGFRRPYC